MSEPQTSIVLLAEGSDAEAMVQMDSGDKFFVAVADAARACQMVDRFKEFGPQFNELVRTLRTWLEDHRDKVKSAHLAIRSRDILFLVIQKSAEFDQQLSESLTELDLLIANSRELNLIELDVLAIPTVSRESANAFLSTGQAYAPGHAGAVDAE